MIMSGSRETYPQPIGGRLAVPAPLSATMHSTGGRAVAGAVMSIRTTAAGAAVLAPRRQMCRRSGNAGERAAPVRSCSIGWMSYLTRITRRVSEPVPESKRTK